MGKSLLWINHYHYTFFRFRMGLFICTFGYSLKLKLRIKTKGKKIVFEAGPGTNYIQGRIIISLNETI